MVLKHRWIPVFNIEIIKYTIYIHNEYLINIILYILLLINIIMDNLLSILIFFLFQKFSKNKKIELTF